VVQPARRPQQQQKNKRPVYLRSRCCNSSVVPEIR